MTIEPKEDTTEFLYIKLVSGDDYIIKVNKIGHVDKYMPVMMFHIRHMQAGGFIPVVMDNLIQVNTVEIYKQHVAMTAVVNETIIDSIMNLQKKDEEESEDASEEQEPEMVYENKKRMTELLNLPLEQYRKKLN